MLNGLLLSLFLRQYPCLQDFIFVAQGATAANFGVVPDKQPNGCCVSDHKPIMAEVSF
jgi:endonuclease/exonuclease/phosphatase family metal-dependent hydrolase